MSEEPSTGWTPQGEAAETVSVSGPSCEEGVMMEYARKLSLEEARIIPQLLSSKKSVKKLTIFEMSLTAMKAAFDKLQDWGSLEELFILHIDCEGEDFDIDLAGAFTNLRCIELHCENIPSSFAFKVANYLRESKSLRELSLWYSCGADEGAAAIAQALTVNNTLKRLTLAQQTLTSQTLVAFAKALVENTTLELVDLFDTCSIDKEQTSFLFEDDLYSNVFRRMLIVWKEDVLPELTRLLREDRHYSEVSVSVTASVDKHLLREFFEAVASNTALRKLHFYPSDDCFDELADGIAFVIERTTTLEEVQNLMHVKMGSEQQLVRMLDALKVNRSVVNFTTYAELLTPEIAKSLSELLAVNDTLRDVAVCEYWGISSEVVETILKGLRKNFTLTQIMVSWDPDESAGITEMEELLKRNTRLLDQAVKFATGDYTDVEAAEAAKKLRSSASFVNRLRELTGKTAEAVLCDLEAAFAARLSV